MELPIETIKAKERLDPNNLSSSCFINPHLRVCLLILVREEVGVRGRAERETLISCLLYAPQPGIEPATSIVFSQGTEPITLQCTGQCSNQLSHPGQGSEQILNGLQGKTSFQDNVIFTSK